MPALDRRGFLLAAAGTAWAAVGVAWWPRAPAAAAASPGLSARRAATFRALVGSLRDAADARFGAVSVADAERRLARWYAGEGAPERARVDAVLDALGRRAVPAYAGLARGAAACRTRAAAPRAAALAAAVDLAAVVCEPAPAEDERPPAPPLELAR
jgi:hypothetical protein